MTCELCLKAFKTKQCSTKLVLKAFANYSQNTGFANSLA